MQRREWLLFGLLGAVALFAMSRSAPITTAVGTTLKRVKGMFTSDEGVKSIRWEEAWRDRAYKDIAGKWTIGWGHLILPDEMATLVGTPVTIGGKERGGIVITQAQGDALKHKDLRIAEDAVNRMVKVPMTQPVFDALVSLVYNIGSGNFAKSSVLTKMNDGDLKGAAEAILLYNKAHDPKTGQLAYSQVLANRRQREKSLFESGLV